MKPISKNCLNCSTLFQAPAHEVKRGNGKFCCLKCACKYNRNNRPKPNPNCICAFCGIEFYKNTSSLNNSRSGLYFCCREHKDISQRIGGIKEIQPDHYGNGDDHSTYRKMALRTLPNCCKICGYDKYIGVLEVHHKDCDRSNNNISNLELLCPTHHDEIHYLEKTGKWARKGSLAN